MHNGANQNHPNAGGNFFNQVAGQENSQVANAQTFTMTREDAARGEQILLEAHKQHIDQAKQRLQLQWEELARQEAATALALKLQADIAAGEEARRKLADLHQRLSTVAPRSYTPARQITFEPTPSTTQIVPVEDDHSPKLPPPSSNTWTHTSTSQVPSSFASYNSQYSGQQHFDFVTNGTQSRSQPLSFLQPSSSVHHRPTQSHPMPQSWAPQSQSYHQPLQGFHQSAQSHPSLPQSYAPGYGSGVSQHQQQQQQEQRLPPPPPQQQQTHAALDQQRVPAQQAQSQHQHIPNQQRALAPQAQSVIPPHRPAISTQLPSSANFPVQQSSRPIPGSAAPPSTTGNTQATGSAISNSASQNLPKTTSGQNSAIANPNLVNRPSDLNSGHALNQSVRPTMHPPVNVPSQNAQANPPQASPSANRQVFEKITAELSEPDRKRVAALHRRGSEWVKQAEPGRLENIPKTCLYMSCMEVGRFAIGVIINKQFAPLSPLGWLKALEAIHRKPAAQGHATASSTSFAKPAITSPPIAEPAIITLPSAPSTAKTAITTPLTAASAAPSSKPFNSAIAHSSAASRVPNERGEQQLVQALNNANNNEYPATPTKRANSSIPRSPYHANKKHLARDVLRALTQPGQGSSESNNIALERSTLLDTNPNPGPTAFPSNQPAHLSSFRVQMNPWKSSVPSTTATLTGGDERALNRPAVTPLTISTSTQSQFSSFNARMNPSGTSVLSNASTPTPARLASLDHQSNVTNRPPVIPTSQLSIANVVGLGDSQGIDAGRGLKPSLKPRAVESSTPQPMIQPPPVVEPPTPVVRPPTPIVQPPTPVVQPPTPVFQLSPRNNAPSTSSAPTLQSSSNASPFVVPLPPASPALALTPANPSVPQLPLISANLVVPQPLQNGPPTPPDEVPLFLPGTPSPPSSPAPMNVDVESSIFPAESDTVRDSDAELVDDDGRGGNKQAGSSKKTLAHVQVPQAPIWVKSYQEHWMKKKKAMQEEDQELEEVEKMAEEVIEILDSDDELEPSRVADKASRRSNSSRATTEAEHVLLSTTSVRDPQEAEVITKSITRLRRSMCQWSSCDVALSSIAKLAQHMRNHVIEIQQAKGKHGDVLCTICGRYRAHLPDHVENHAYYTLDCPYQDCEESFRVSRKLLQHTLSGHRPHAPLKPSTDLLFPVAPMSPPDAPPTLPSYMVVARAITPHPISKERHQLLGPWVLRNMMPPVDTVSLQRYLKAKHLGHINIPSASDEYDFLVTRSSYSCMPSRPAKIRDLGDLNSDQVSTLINDGMSFWQEEEISERESPMSLPAVGFDEPGEPSRRSTDELALRGEESQTEYSHIMLS